MIKELVYDLTWNYHIKNMNLTDTTTTTTEKIKLIGYLILGDITFCNFKNEHFEKKKSIFLTVTSLVHLIWKCSW